ncbi:hypothetical protein FQA39_LY15684 [Lamprigera yunnana]|nr:hypothetical protein FQA39_LY15684 [Lamprigera yunnana]
MRPKMERYTCRFNFVIKCIEDFDLPAELESQFIFRLPEEPNRILREAIHNNSTLKDRFSIKIDDDLRHGKVRVDHYLMNAKVVDMPSVVKSLKTIDYKSFYKTADICQMVICKEEDDQVVDKDSPQKKKKDPNKVDKKYLWPHGITPPAKNVRKRWFRKTFKKNDNGALGIKWEMINEDDENKVNRAIVIKKEPLELNNQNVTEHDIFGGAVSDSEKEDAYLNVLELDENSQNSGEDSHLTDSNSILNPSMDTKILTEFFKVDNKMDEIQEQVDNNSGEINGIWERLREQGTKLINVEAKINQHKEERIQVCEDLKEQKREIVNYIEEKIKIGNGTGHNVITNYSKIEREAPKFHPSKNQHTKVHVQELQTYLEVIKKQIGNQYDQAMEDAIIREAMRGDTETWYRTKEGEYRNFQEPQKGFMNDYWEIKEESVMKSELYGTTFNHSLRCGKDGVRNDGNEYYNHYNNYEQRKYNYSGQGRNNHNYSQGAYQGNQFYHYHKNRNSRSCGTNLNINKIIQQPRKNVDTIEGSEDYQNSDDDKEKDKILFKILPFCSWKDFVDFNRHGGGVFSFKNTIKDKI